MIKAAGGCHRSTLLLLNGVIAPIAVAYTSPGRGRRLSDPTWDLDTLPGIRYHQHSHSLSELGTDIIHN